MELLFESNVVTILLLAAYLCFSRLPRRIEVLYYQKHLLKNGYFSSVTEKFGLIVLISLNVFYVIEYGFHNGFVYFFLFFYIAITLMVLYSQYQKHFTNKKPSVFRKIYYGLEDVSDEIDLINQKYPQITIKKAMSNSPIILIIKSIDTEVIEDLIELVSSEDSIFADLSTNKYRIKLYINILFFSLALIYLISLVIYRII
ncbi:MAG: hypothetical protein QM489_07735 [Candidatus Izemoplasma sp.]